jgi:menaquinone-dependent protoporphyrinogen oxidase
MTVLVAYATAHGSTREIAERIGARLREMGFDIVVEQAETTTNVAGYEAVVLGSAIHSGHWLPEAEALVEAQATLLRTRPVWLFSVATIGASSSALGRPATWLARKAGAAPQNLGALLDRTGARGHRAFAGVIREGDWGRMGGIFLRLAGGRYGDYRDWRDIDQWAQSVGRGLHDQASVSNHATSARPQS